jgi:predicted small secreted protein
MNRRTIVAKAVAAWAILVLAVAMPLLSACHTTAGAGEDISATGSAIDRAARKATP